jgi:hypothetical protein
MPLLSKTESAVHSADGNGLQAVGGAQVSFMAGRDGEGDERAARTIDNQVDVGASAAARTA